MNADTFPLADAFTRNTIEELRQKAIMATQSGDAPKEYIDHLWEDLESHMADALAQQSWIEREWITHAVQEFRQELEHQEYVHSMYVEV